MLAVKCFNFSISYLNLHVQANVFMPEKMSPGRYNRPGYRSVKQNNKKRWLTNYFSPTGLARRVRVGAVYAHVPLLLVLLCVCVCVRAVRGSYYKNSSCALFYGLADHQPTNTATRHPLPHFNHGCTFVFRFFTPFPLNQYSVVCGTLFLQSPAHLQPLTSVTSSAPFSANVHKQRSAQINQSPLWSSMCFHVPLGGRRLVRFVDLLLCDSPPSPPSSTACSLHHRWCTYVSRGLFLMVIVFPLLLVRYWPVPSLVVVSSFGLFGVFADGQNVFCVPCSYFSDKYQRGV